MASIPIPQGINAITPGQIPDQWSKSWFINFISTWLAPADVRNATAGSGITITAQGTSPATISSSLSGIENAEIVVLTSSPVLLQERVLTGQSGFVTITDGGAGNQVTVGINAGMTPTWTGL